MSFKLSIILVIFSLIWFIIIFRCLKKNHISIKYSLPWFSMILIIFFVGALPDMLKWVASLFGFLTISNLIIGVILTTLMFICLTLSIIVTQQRNQIKTIVQEISILKGTNKNEK